MEKYIFNRKNSGITLIALVVSIIVLLILAGVSISMLNGENGILKRATEAKEKVQESSIEEQKKLSIIEAQSNLEETNYNGVTIPSGFAPTRIKGENTINDGLVITDSYGNEYVWIEVPKSIMSDNLKFENQNDYITLASELKNYASPYTKGKNSQNYSWTDEFYTNCGIENEEKYNELYKKMLKSIYTNNGFWISRYEAGISGTTNDNWNSDLARTSYSPITNASPKAISQKNAIPYNYISCSDAQLLASEMVTNSLYTSSLMFGIQWDLVCKFLEVNSTLDIPDINSNSTNWGNYKVISFNIENGKYSPFPLENSSWENINNIFNKPSNTSILLSTGITERNKMLNIYDFAGNVYEFTLEHANTNASSASAYRGGYCNNSDYNSPASVRYNCPSTFSDFGIGFRSTIF